MLNVKIVFNFRTRGVWFFVWRGPPDQLFAGYFACIFICQFVVRISWKMGDFMYKFHILSENILFEKIWLCFVSHMVISQLAGTCMDAKDLWWKSTRIFLTSTGAYIFFDLDCAGGLLACCCFCLSKKLYLYLVFKVTYCTKDALYNLWLCCAQLL
jgi:hypothetical protein